MNYPILFRLLSLIVSFITIAFLGCLGLAYQLKETQAIEGFHFSITITGLLAILCYILGRNAEAKIFRKEALCVIGVGWIACSLVGALPYIFILETCSIADAIFESTSGITTTGASVLSNLEEISRSLLFWRSLSQWIGGLGVVVFFVAILSSLGAGAKTLFSHESSAHAHDMDSGRIQTGILRILYLYLILSVACLLSLRLCGLSWFDATCHMFTTISTAGFSTYSQSIQAFNSPLIEWVIILYMILGGTSFLFMLRILRGNFSEIKSNTEAHVFYLLILASTLLLTFYLLEQGNTASFSTIIRTSAFQAVSILTTTGFTTTDFDVWLPPAKILLLVMMVIGGCSGSTSGGIKTIRAIVALRIAGSHIEKAFRANVVRPIRFHGRSLKDDAQVSFISYIVLIGIISLASVLILSSIEHQLDFMSTFSAVHACLFNIGPAFGQVGPTQNYAFLHEHTKLYLSLLMIMGRLELYAVLVLFVPSFWKRFS